MSHHPMDYKATDVKTLARKYWILLSGIVFIGIVAVGGVRFWQAHNQATLIHTSSQFDRLVANLDANKPTTLDELVSFADTEKNSYGVLASLKAAQFYVMVLKNYQAATTLLENALPKTNDEVLQAILLVRIARLQSQLGLNEQSLATLGKIKDASWIPVVETIRGDVLFHQHAYVESAAAYEKALDAEPVPVWKSTISMKLNQTLYLIKKEQSNNKQSSDITLPMTGEAGKKMNVSAAGL